MGKSQDVGRKKKKKGKKAGENIGEGREEKQDHALGLALGAQFQILHWQFESQGRGPQGVDHVLVALPAVLS